MTDPQRCTMHQNCRVNDHGEHFVGATDPQREKALTEVVNKVDQISGNACGHNHSRVEKDVRHAIAAYGREEYQRGMHDAAYIARMVGTPESISIAVGIENAAIRAGGK